MTRRLSFFQRRAIRRALEARPETGASYAEIAADLGVSKDSVLFEAHALAGIKRLDTPDGQATNAATEDVE